MEVILIAVLVVVLLGVGLFSARHKIADVAWAKRQDRYEELLEEYEQAVVRWKLNPNSAQAKKAKNEAGHRLQQHRHRSRI